MMDINESVVAGDSGGDPEAIAKGETSGSVTGKGPTTVDPNKKKTFDEFVKGS
jgi:hypothetical protein